MRYDDIIYRFADYNAGVYASRNAAVQAQLTQLTGKKLVLDGDLLSYEKDGTARDDETESMRALQSFAQRFAPDLSPRQLRRDLQKEKTLEFEETATYRALKTAAAPPARTSGAVRFAAPGRHLQPQIHPHPLDSLVRARGSAPLRQLSGRGRRSLTCLLQRSPGRARRPKRDLVQRRRCNSSSNTSSPRNVEERNSAGS